MTKGRDLVASVRQRLLNLSRERGEDFQLVLNRYGLERLLYRITQSAYAGQFVLKGAALFQLWTGQPHRSTRDLDLLGQGEPSLDRLRQAFQDVCSVTVADDGLTFLTDAIRATFERRRTALPGTVPLALTSEFGTDRQKSTQWNAFVRKGELAESPPHLEDVISLLEVFLMPPTRAFVANDSWEQAWSSGAWS